MDSFELNKVTGAVLGTLLFALGTGFVAELIYEPKPAGNRGWELPGGSAEHGGGGEAKAAEAPTEEPIAVRLAHADIEKGKAGTKACQGCHNFEEGAGSKVGPDLYNVVERKKGSFPGFDYSAGLKEKGGDWTYADLDQFLTKPSAYIKGTKMSFAGIQAPQDRANVIGYLRTLSKEPKPLPAADQAEGKKDAAKGEAAGGDKKAEGGAAAGGDAFAVKVASADAKKGEAGTKACQACHNFAEGAGPKVGPDLYGVVGRKKGSVAGFDYSAGMKGKGGEWTYADLNQFLTKPSDYVKGTKMAFAGISDEGKRAEVVAYLRTLAKDPQPLPGADAKGSDKGAQKQDEGKQDEGKKTEATPEGGASQGDASKKPAEKATSTGDVAPAEKGAGNGGSNNGTSQGADKPAAATPAGSTDSGQPATPSSPNAVEPASKPDQAAEEKAKEGESGHQ